MNGQKYKRLPVPDQGLRKEFTMRTAGGVETFEMVIDLLALARRLGTQAARNKTKRTKSEAGLIVCRKLREVAK